MGAVENRAPRHVGILLNRARPQDLLEERLNLSIKANPL